jgi:Pentapeptide repeats (8 copies)
MQAGAPLFGGASPEGPHVSSCDEADARGWFICGGVEAAVAQGGGGERQETALAERSTTTSTASQPGRTSSAEESALTLKKVTAEVDKLNAEIRNLQLTNEALGTWTRRLSTWLGAISGVVVAMLGVLVTLVGLRVNRSFNSAQTRKLEQERELEREKHDMELFQNLGHDSLRVQLAAAAALIQRLEICRLTPGPSEAMQLEKRTIIQVLVAVVKKSDPGAPSTEPGWPMSLALSLPRLTAPKRSEAVLAHPALSKLIADNLVKAMGALIPAGNDRTFPERSESPLHEFDFQKVQFPNAYWKRVNARNVDFFRADLSQAGLPEADLTGAVLKETNLNGTVLRDAHLDLADLREADLRGADVSGATFEGAKVAGAQVNGVTWKTALSGRVDRSAAADGSNMVPVGEWLTAS